MTRRRDFSRKIKVAAFERADGRCEDCTSRLSPGNVEYDHRVPFALGGESTLENCQVLCFNCHGGKTAKTDAPTIAKNKRVRARHIGAKTPPRHVIDGSKASRWKKKMDGTVVRR